jgi:hypothetical protein
MSLFSPNTEVGGTAFAASIGCTSRREIWGSIDLIQPLRSPTSCAAKLGAACGTSNFGIRAAFQQGLLAALPDIQTGSRNAWHLAQRRSGLIGEVSRLPATD